MAETGDDSFFLPDFCDFRMVFAVVLSGQLLAIVLVLATLGSGDDWWQRLAVVSVFVQWVGLSSAAVLCVSRRWLRSMGDVKAGLTSYALVMAVAAGLTEAAYWLIAERLVLLDVADWGALMSAPGAVPMAHLEFLSRSLSIAAIFAAVMLRYLYVQHQWKRRLESESRARIQALQSRIRPHFLFNCMNTIASLTRSNPRVAEQVTEDLAELFRESLGDAGVPTTLARELELCRQYLRIEQQRLGERLRCAWIVDDLPGRALLPRLTLQPLIENAVYHGVEPAPEGGSVTVEGMQHGGLLRIVVSNPVPRPSHSSRSSRREGLQIAQRNVSERLEAFFGPQARVQAVAGDDRYQVLLEFPLVEGRA